MVWTSLRLLAVMTLAACSTTVATGPVAPPACRADCAASASAPAPAPAEAPPAEAPPAEPLATDAATPDAAGSSGGNALGPMIAPSSGGLGVLAGLSPRGGVGRARARSVPRLTVGTPTVGPALSSDVIRRIILRRRMALRFCYERALATKPTLAGAVRVRFAIGATGDVVSAAVTTGLDPAVDACVAHLLRATKFPPPSGGGVVIVTYPFTFAPPPGP